MGETHLYNNGRKPAPSPVADAPGLTQLYHPPARPSPLRIRPLLKESTYPLEERTCRLEERTCALRERTYPLEERTYPLGERTYPLRERTYPLRESTYTLGEPAWPLRTGATQAENLVGARRKY
jgi:hypothetical protein